MRVIQLHLKCKLTALSISKLNHNLFDIYGDGALKKTQLHTSHMITGMILEKSCGADWVSIPHTPTHTLFDFVASRLCKCKLLSSTSTLIHGCGRSKKMWEDRG